MNTSDRAVRFDDNTMGVDLSDGRVIAVPLARFPRLMNATPEQRSKVEFSARGLHWEQLEEDIAIDGLLAGIGDLSREDQAAT